MSRLGPDFFQQDSLTVARSLIGKTLVYEQGETVLKGMIIETEAYTEDDPACHTYQGKRTPRTEPMFKPGGHWYLYLIYGMYHCLNMVTEAEGTGAAVLLRAVTPLSGIEKMRANRHYRNEIANGPGKLVQAYNIPTHFNGKSSVTGPLYIDDPQTPAPTIKRTPRIGISAGQDRLWRFVTDAIPGPDNPKSAPWTAKD
ncbi:MAG: 3-methyladenine DNA glycosylase [Actinobacteria bacterium]|nr:3-methyladenine DNA glycosylase [Actinomycetota bacterium]